MARRCELTDKRTRAGQNISHAQNKTKRKFKVNLQTLSLRSDILEQDFSLRIATSTLRSIDHNGGLDNFLLTAKAANLSKKGAALRRKLNKIKAAKSPKKKAS